MHTCCRRKKISSATSKEFPGDDIPVYKDNPSVKAKVDALVTRLLDDVKPEFNAFTVKRYILDCLNERRRHRRNGYDYKNVSKNMHPNIVNEIFLFSHLIRYQS